MSEIAVRINKACLQCSRSKLSCDGDRPCSRCVDRKMSGQCSDVPRLKRVVNTVSSRKRVNRCIPCKIYRLKCDGQIPCKSCILNDREFRCRELSQEGNLPTNWACERPQTEIEEKNYCWMCPSPNIFQYNMILDAPMPALDLPRNFSSAEHFLLDFSPMQISDLFKLSVTKIRYLLTFLASYLSYDGLYAFLPFMRDSAFYGSISESAISQINTLSQLMISKVVRPFEPSLPYDPLVIREQIHCPSSNLMNVTLPNLRLEQYRHIIQFYHDEYRPEELQELFPEARPGMLIHLCFEEQDKMMMFMELNEVAEVFLGYTSAELSTYTLCRDMENFRAFLRCEHGQTPAASYYRYDSFQILCANSCQSLFHPDDIIHLLAATLEIFVGQFKSKLKIVRICNRTGHYTSCAMLTELHCHPVEGIPQVLITAFVPMTHNSMSAIQYGKSFPSDVDANS